MTAPAIVTIKLLYLAREDAAAFLSILSAMEIKP